MNLDQFLEKLKEDKNFFINNGLDILYSLSELTALINNFEILYGVKIDLSFNQAEEVKGRWWGKGMPEKIKDLYKI